MNRLFGTLPIAAALALTPVGLAQSSDAPPRAAQPEVSSYFNAALEYWKIWDALDYEMVNQIQDDIYEAEENDGPFPTEALLKLQPQIQAMIRASQMPICDWQTDFSKGFEAVLPHLGKVRMNARLLGADARRLLAEGDTNGATIRAVAEVDMAMQVADESFLIGSLVGMAVGSHSTFVTDEILDSGKSTQDNRDMLLAAYNRIEMDNVFGIVDAIVLERDVTVQWLESEFTGENSRDVSGLLAYLSAEAPPEEDHPLSSFTDEDIVNDLAKLSSAYDALLSAWNAEDANEQLGDINLAVEAGEFGELAKVILPALTNVRRSTDRISVAITATKKRIAETKDEEDAGSDK